MLPEKYVRIHEVLHDDSKPESVEVEGLEFPIKTAFSGLRYVDFEGYRFMQQNPAKNSPYAARARNGEKITWGMTNGSWILIDDMAVTQSRSASTISPLNPL